ncbi:unnamed protein product [Adineta steineri]|uniref:CBM1 domain-containing protein n=1 Tax=Adineta steineri TaxID=433720 RepID=A0A818VFM2_9BILA|nr:unnamed protein product [Adineta steineri]
MTSALLTKLALFAAILNIAYSVGIYEQCAGDGYGTFPCDAGLTCFRRNIWYSSCQTSCPKGVGWECETYVPPVVFAAGWDQCGGEGWYGPRACPAGYACYARSIYYSQCRPVNDCPAGWGCAALFVPSTPTPVVSVVPVTGTPVVPVVSVTATPVVPVVTVTTGPVVLPAYAQCNHVAGAVCAAGTACFRSNVLYSECRPACPPTWACQTDVAQLNEQCGGEGFVGLTRCAEGLRCYVATVWYSKCAASCPPGWQC